ncbi:MAG: hypothetical protein NTX76_01930 [Alphaproteobacteria bacterium]|nr:hypothetical protein [Alphaproteobacteria bacterium]
MTIFVSILGLIFLLDSAAHATEKRDHPPILKSPLSLRRSSTIANLHVTFGTGGNLEQEIPYIRTSSKDSLLSQQALPSMLKDIMLVYGIDPNCRTIEDGIYSRYAMILGYGNKSDKNSDYTKLCEEIAFRMPDPEYYDYKIGFYAEAAHYYECIGDQEGVKRVRDASSSLFEKIHATSPMKD